MFIAILSLACAISSNGEKDVYNIQKFDGINFAIWKDQIQDVLIQKGQLDRPKGEYTDTEWQKLDAKAKSTIRLHLVESVYFTIVGERTTRDVWDKLCSNYENKIAINKVFLIKRLFDLRMKEEGTISTCINEFNIIFTQLTTQGLVFDDEIKCIFLLCSLPSSWDTFYTTISNLAFEKSNSSSSESSEDDRKKKKKGSWFKNIDDMPRRISEISGLRGSARKTEKWYTKCKGKNHTTEECTQRNYSKAFGHEWTNCKIRIHHLKEGKDLSMIAFASMELVAAITEQSQTVSTNSSGYNGRVRTRGRGGNGNTDFKRNFNCYKCGKYGHFGAQCPELDKPVVLEAKQPEHVLVRAITRSLVW
ncbi:hypothetical protein L7F22_003728 [Adiantum nelumboides]|nr:hypothetical protein [Adiantum nelumboides]